MKTIRTLVILADDRRARFLINQGPGKGLVEQADFIKPDKTRYADAPGRGTAVPGVARHGLDRSTSEEAQDRASFAAELAAEVSRLWQGGGFDRAVLAAPPKMLGALRAELAEPVRTAMVAELPKDFLTVPAGKLPECFEDHIVF